MSPEQVFNAIITFFHEGGIFMLPTLLTLAVGLAVAVERWLFLSASAEAQGKTLNKISPLLARGHFEQALEASREDDSPLAGIFAAGLERHRSSKARDDLEMAMEENLMAVMPRLEKRTHYLATLANVAMLLGLLGTIMGLIHGFAGVASVDPAERSRLLSAAVSEAMNNTAFGLFVAIPFLLIHAVLSSKTTQLIEGLEMAAVKLLNALHRAPEQE